MADRKLKAVPESMPAFLTRPQVEALVGLSCSSLYRLMAAAEFPRPVRIARRAVRWRRSDLEAYLDDRPMAGPETRTAAPQ